MAIEGRSDTNKGGRIKLGMVGGGEGAFIGAVHRSRPASTITTSSSPAPCRRRRRRRGAPARRWVWRRTASMTTTRAWRRPRPSTPINRGGRHRHAQRRSRRADLRLSEGRRPCHLRQAADGEPRGSEEDARRGREVGPRVRADPQLHRLSAGAPDARDGAGGRTWRDPSRSRRISAGLAGRPDRKNRQQAGRMARRSEAFGRGRRRSATSARMPITWPTT